MLTGHIHIGPDLDYIERAFDHVKYGEVSDAPWLDITVPSVLDAELAPAGGHVMSVYAHYAPHCCAERLVLDATDAADPSHQDVGRPRARTEFHRRRRHHTAEMHSDYGFSGGHIFHGELSADQLYAMRPLLGMGRYETPVRGVFLCGASTPRRGFLSGINGRLAAQHLLRSGAVR